MSVKQKPKQLGRVVAVRQDRGMSLCSVQLGHTGGAVDNVLVGKGAPGLKVTPEPGWLVVVDYLDDGTPIIDAVVSQPEFQMPDLAEGSFSFRFNAGTAITVEKQADGTYNIDVEADGNVSVTAGGEAAVSASGDVSVDGSTIALGPTGNALVTNVSVTKDVDGHVTDVATEKTTKTTAE